MRPSPSTLQELQREWPPRRVSVCGTVWLDSQFVADPSASLKCRKMTWLQRYRVPDDEQGPRSWSAMSSEDVDAGVNRDGDERKGLGGTGNTSPIDRTYFSVAIAWSGNRNASTSLLPDLPLILHECLLNSGVHPYHHAPDFVKCQTKTRVEMVRLPLIKSFIVFYLFSRA